jgi:hypothetical protein
MSAPAGVTNTRTSRRFSATASRLTKPFPTRRSHILVTVEGATPNSAARFWADWGPRLCSTTSVRYWANVTFSFPASDRDATATNTRDADSTASVTSSTPEDSCTD